MMVSHTFILQLLQLYVIYELSSDEKSCIHFLTNFTTVVILLEIGFFFYFINEVKSLQWFRRPPSYSKSYSKDGREEVFRRLQNVLSLESWGDGKGSCDFFRVWFLNTIDKPSSLRKGMCYFNFVYFLYFFFFIFFIIYFLLFYFFFHFTH